MWTLAHGLHTQAHLRFHSAGSLLSAIETLGKIRLDSVLQEFRPVKIKDKGKTCISIHIEHAGKSSREQTAHKESIEKL